MYVTAFVSFSLFCSKNPPYLQKSAKNVSYGFMFVFYSIEYQLFVRPKTWGDAQNHCRRLGKELVTIESAGENFHLKRIIADQYV